MTFCKHMLKNFRLRIFQTLLLWAIFSLQAMAVQPGESAPKLKLPELETGNVISLNDLTGKIVYIDFWASWCGPCRQEMPLLNALHNKYEPLGFTVLGVNVEEQVENAKAFLADRPVDFPILLDSNNRISKLYDVVAMPSTVVIDRDGNIRFIHYGYQKGDEVKYRNMVKTLIRE